MKQLYKRLIVLRSLINKVTVFLHPDYIAAVMHTGLLKKHISKKEIIPIEHTGSSVLNLEVIETLNQLLTKPDWKACDINIILSGHFTKFRISKWNDALSKDERKTLVRHQMDEIYDNKLHVFFSGDRFGKNALAVAIELDFYNLLLDLEKKLKIRLLSINPYFVVIANYWRSSIASTALMIVKENAFVYIATTNVNSWEMIKTIPMNEGWESDVDKLISRKMMQFEVKAAPMNIYFHDEKKSKFVPNVFSTNSNNVISLNTNGMPDANAKFLFASYLS